jgi:hypothetical protein
MGAGMGRIGAGNDFGEGRGAGAAAGAFARCRVVVVYVVEGIWRRWGGPLLVDLVQRVGWQVVANVVQSILLGVGRVVLLVVFLVFVLSGNGNGNERSQVKFRSSKGGNGLGKAQRRELFAASCLKKK